MSFFWRWLLLPGGKAGVGIPAVLWMILLFILSAIPGTEYPKVRYEDADKIVHLVMYTPLGILLMRWLGRGEGNFGRGMAVVAGFMYAASDEWHQSFVPNRSASVADWLTDCIGLVLGGLVWYSLYVKVSRRGRGQLQDPQESA